MEMLDNINLVKKYERIEHAERRVIQDSRKHDVLEVLQPVCVMDLPLYGIVLYPYDLLELRFVSEVLSVVGFV